MRSLFWFLNSQNFASILPLSNYIHTYYQLPHNPIHHVLLSPLENIFYTMHAEYMLVPLKERNRKKENLILIDSDLKNDLFVPEHILGKYSKATLWANVAVIHVRIIFIGAFLFYCLLLNHSFPTNPNSITNCF